MSPEATDGCMYSIFVILHVASTGVFTDDTLEDFEDDFEVERLTNRVWNIQTSVNEISSIVKNIFGLLSTKSNHITTEL